MVAFTWKFHFIYIAWKVSEKSWFSYYVRNIFYVTIYISFNLQGSKDYVKLALIKHLVNWRAMY